MMMMMMIMMTNPNRIQNQYQLTVSMLHHPKMAVFERIRLLAAGKKEIEASMATSPLVAPATATSEISILEISHYGFLHVYFEEPLKEQQQQQQQQRKESPPPSPPIQIPTSREHPMMHSAN
jgi:hypothetical protein